MSDTWNVIVLGFDAPEAWVVEGLRREFGVDEEMARRVFRSTPRAVKHDVSRELAEAYAATLARLGGRFELQPSSHAFLETSAGEHVSPVRRPYGLGAGHNESPGAIGSEADLVVDAPSGLEIDVARANRKVEQGQADTRQRRTSDPRMIATARNSSWPPARNSSWPPAASQSLPPPRMVEEVARHPKDVPQPSRGRVLIGVGVLLIVLAILGARTVLNGELRMAVPVLEGVGALLLARGIWQRFAD